MNTVTQRLLEMKLFDLITEAGPFLQVLTTSNSDSIARESKTGANKYYGNKVSLILLEPQNDADLQLWEVAIKNAEDLVAEVKEEHDWNLTNPNFYKRISYKISHEKNKNQR